MFVPPCLSQLLSLSFSFPPHEIRQSKAPVSAVCSFSTKRFVEVSRKRTRVVQESSTGCCRCRPQRQAFVWLRLVVSYAASNAAQNDVSRRAAVTASSECQAGPFTAKIVSGFAFCFIIFLWRFDLLHTLHRGFRFVCLGNS